MSRKYVRSFVIGGLMGIAAGMILLPKMNEETKDRLTGMGVELFENAARRTPEMERRY